MILSDIDCASSCSLCRAHDFGQCRLLVDLVNLLSNFVIYVGPQGILTEPEIGQGFNQQRQGVCAHSEFQTADPPFMEPCIGDVVALENLCQGMGLVVIKMCSLGSLIT